MSAIGIEILPVRRRRADPPRESSRRRRALELQPSEPPSYSLAIPNIRHGGHLFKFSIQNIEQTSGRSGSWHPGSLRRLILRPTSDHRISCTSMNSSASRAVGTGLRLWAAKRWISSSVNPGVVRMDVSGRTRSALIPASSRSSRLAQASGGSPGSSRPAGISQRYPLAAWRNWRSKMTRGSAEPGGSRKGTTAAAPGWRIISSCPVLPSGNFTVSTSRSMTRPEYFRSVVNLVMVAPRWAREV